MFKLPKGPSPAVLTEKNFPDQHGKVFMITGATSGIGQELAKILYGANATVWIVARSKQKAEETVAAIGQAHPGSKGRMEVLIADFNDLHTIRPAAEEFLQRESRLDVLWNNAGIMIPPKGTVTAQGYEAQLGVNNLGPFLFTKLLTPLIIKTAQESPANSVRVVWVSSSAAEHFSPPGGVEMDKLTMAAGKDYSQWQRYGASKAGDIYQSAEYARRYGPEKVTSVALDPGNLDTNLYKDMGRVLHFISKLIALKPVIYGAYTELFGGLSIEVKNGDWVEPFGKVSQPREDIREGCKSGLDGGSGRAREFWEWCERETSAL